jgi:hypothetical protein
VADETSDVTRYYLLETMRQFGQANLSAAGTDALYRDRHADYYTEYVLSRRPRLHGSEDQAALDEIEPELENIRVALRRAADDSSSPHFEELYCALYLLWIGRNRSSEGTSWATELRARPLLDPATRIRTLGVAVGAANPYSLALANELGRAAAELAAATNAAAPLLALATGSVTDMMQGRSEEAIASCDQVIALASTEPDPFIRCAALANTLAVLASCGAIDHIEDVRTNVAALAEELGNEYLRTTMWTAMAPIIDVVDPVQAGDFLLRGYERNGAIRNGSNQSVIAMFLAIHELRSGNEGAAASWAMRSLRLAADHGLGFLAQTTSVIVATVKRHSPPDAAILLGALRAHRVRKQQAGTKGEIDAESRLETSLRRLLGVEFDALYANGQALDETAMITVAFSQLGAIIESAGERAGP